MKIKRTHDKFYLRDIRKSKPKEYFKFLLKIIENRFKLKELKTSKLEEIKIIDIGCATGDLAYFIKSNYPLINYIGVDVDKDLLKRAKKEVPNVNFKYGNIMKISSFKKNYYDIVLLISVHMIWDSFEIWLNNTINLAKKNGKVLIFGMFNPEKCDVLVKIRKSDKNVFKNHWESGWNNWSINTISKYLKNKKIKFKFYEWNINKSLKKNPDPLRSYTQKLINKKYQIITGSQLILNLYLLEITK